MPRTTEQNEALRSATRSAVETAAVRRFAHHGFAATNMRQIATDARLSAGSIYRHYASKEALFDALIDRAIRGLESVAAQLAGEGDPVALIRSFTEQYVADLAANDGAAEFSVMMHQCVTTDTPQGTAARLHAAQTLVWESFASLVHRGQTQGTLLHGDPERLTVHFFAMLTGVTALHFAVQQASAEPDVELILRVLTGGQCYED